jgi:hypothetical protein
VEALAQLVDRPSLHRHGVTGHVAKINSREPQAAVEGVRP